MSGMARHMKSARPLPQKHFDMELIADVIIGIDPGVNGGVALWTPNTGVQAFKMPETSDGVIDVLTSCEGKKIAALEKVNSYHIDTAVPGKRFGIDKMLENFTTLKTLLDVLGIPYLLVHPMSWQSEFQLRKSGEEKRDRKNRYKEIARAFYPDIKVTLWNADALLLTAFMRKKKIYDPLWIYKRLPAKAREKAFTLK